MRFVITKYWLFYWFLTFNTFIVFNSTYVNNFSIVSFDIIRPLRRLCDKQGFTQFLTILSNCSVGVTVAVDRYVNSSIYIFGIYDFLWFTLDLYILGPLKCLMTSGSINSIETTNPLFFWALFLILFLHVSVENKRDWRLKYVLVTFAFLSSNFNLSTYGDIVYNNVNIWNRLQFDSSDYISTCKELHKICLLSQFSILIISKLKAIDNNKSFYRLILIFYSDISLNPGPVYNHHPPNLKEWDILKIKGLRLLHLNVNSLLPKIDGLRYIAKLSNAAVIRITESKLNNYILDSEIEIDNYQILRCDNNRKGGGVVCYVRNDLSYIEKDLFLEEIENMLFEILLLKTKPITVGIIYRPPNQNNFL